MTRTLHLLLVEDTPDDAKLILRELSRHGWLVESQRVETAEQLRAALATPAAWDAILCDYALPGFSGEAALQLLQSTGRDIPFIFVSGMMGEDLAVAAMKAGAQDYVMKANLARLAPAIERELREAIERRQHREAERQMRMSEHKYRHLFQSLSDAALVVSEDTDRIIDANQQAEILFGCAREQLLGQCSAQLRAPAGATETNPAPPAARDPVGQFATAIQRRDGSIVPVDVSVSRVTLFERAFLLMLFRDIAARKQAEEVLHGHQQEFQALAENAPDAICRFDRNCRIVYVNPVYVRVLGLPPQQLLGRTPVEVYPGMPAIGEYQRKILDVLSTGTPVAYETALETIHTEPPRWYHIRLAPERDREGRIASVLNVGRDITPLKETERQLRSLTENSPDIIVRYDRHGRYLYVNAAMERSTGIPVTEYLGRQVGDLAARDRPEVVAQFQELGRLIARVVADGQASETEIRLPLPRGEMVYHVRLIPERDDAQQVVSVLMIAQDITARKHVEEALRGSEQRFRQVTENIDEVFWLTDTAKNQMIYISPAYARLWGRTCESLYAQPQSWLEAIHPDDRERVRAALGSQSAGAYDIEYRIVRPDGAVRWVHDRAFPISDATGQVYRVAGVAEDITVRHQLEDQLRQLQKMEAIGQLAGGIAHDFNNILTGMLGAAELARLELPAGHKARPWVESVTSIGKRAKDLVGQILTFSRKKEGELAPQKLQLVVEEALKLLRSTLPSMVEIRPRIDPLCPPVLADATQIHQVVMNLCTNAWHALPEHGGWIEIGLHLVRVSPAVAGRRLGLKPDAPYVVLTVQDNGAGMPPDVLSRVFEPFFTTKKLGHGTGLGLAVVHGIVQGHHGAIFADSTPGEGTRFEVYLPVLRAADSAAPTGGEEPLVPGQGQRILLVDDDADALASMRGQLEHLGYRVTALSDPEAALQRYQASPVDFDLLLTDHGMPGMSGEQLAAKVLAANPQFPVLLASGFLEPARKQEMARLGVREFVVKPPALAELSRLLAKHLAGATAR